MFLKQTVGGRNEVKVKARQHQGCEDVGFQVDCRLPPNEYQAMPEVEERVNQWISTQGSPTLDLCRALVVLQCPPIHPLT